MGLRIVIAVLLIDELPQARLAVFIEWRQAIGQKAIFGLAHKTAADGDGRVLGKWQGHAQMLGRRGAWSALLEQ